jgi:hypothetical protein
MYGGTRNYLLNGDFQVWQRGTSFTVGAVSKVYGADRWCQGRGSTAGSTMAQVSITSASGRLPLDFRYACRVQRTAADTSLNDVTIVQAIESANAVQLRGKTVILSYWVRTGAGWAGNWKARIFTGTGTDENLFTGMTGRLNPLNILTTFTASSDWTFYSHAVTLDSGTNGINVAFSYTPTNATAVANEYFDITGIQLELARDSTMPVATAYEYIPFDSELFRCQRYYQKSFPYSIAPAQGTNNSIGIYQFPCMVSGVASTVGTSQPLIPRMRTTPTMTFYNPISANAFVRNYSTSTDATATSGSGVGEKSFGLSCIGIAGFAVGHLLGVHWQADAEI